MAKVKPVLVPKRFIPRSDHGPPKVARDLQNDAKSDPKIGTKTIKNVIQKWTKQNEPKM